MSINVASTIVGPASWTIEALYKTLTHINVLAFFID
jgi:hypothetical protein